MTLKCGPAFIAEHEEQSVTSVVTRAEVLAGLEGLSGFRIDDDIRLRGKRLLNCSLYSTLSKTLQFSEPFSNPTALALSPRLPRGRGPG
jgi:hypothetical protein